jgi:hypothetical protein
VSGGTAAATRSAAFSVVEIETPGGDAPLGLAPLSPLAHAVTTSTTATTASTTRDMAQRR